MLVDTLYIQSLAAGGEAEYRMPVLDTKTVLSTEHARDDITRTRVHYDLGAYL